MANILETKDYFKKLQKAIVFDAVFKFAGYSLVKKGKLDDILCCIYASLPDSYKEILGKRSVNASCDSALCYNVLLKHLSKQFFLDKNLYVVNTAEASKLINHIVSSIERDLDSIDNPKN